MTKRRRDRFERSKIIIPILLAGWIPSVLTLIVSYTILRDTLESRILRDRQTLIQLVSHLVGHDLSRTTSLVEYYQTLPDTARVLTADNSPAAQQWVNSAFYSHPQIDGMFVTAADGTLIASIPTAPELVGKDFGSQHWREEAADAAGVFVSAVHPRLSDNRPITDIVGAVRAPDGSILGYVGVAVLVERIGRRLSTIEFSDRLLFEVLDQNGAALFASDFKPNPATGSAAANGELIKEVKESKTGHFERHGNLYSFSPIESTGWVAVVEQPRTLAYKPVHDLLGRMTVLAAWLVVLTAVFAWLGSRFYQRQLESKQQLEREVIFNEKMLANMPGGIALVDPVSRRFLHANDAFARMAERFGELPEGREITKIVCDEVKIAPPGAVERVLNFGTPFQLTEHPLKDKSGLTHFLDVNLLRLQGAHKTVQGVLYLVEDKTRDVTLRQELIAANAAKDQFLAQLSHELRSPLTPVIAMVGELEAELPDSKPVKEALEVVRRNVELEARLIDDLLDVTRISRGKLQLSFEPICIHQTLQRAYEICRKEIEAKDLQVSFALRATNAYVEGDPARLQQVFWNLIKNSVKFTPENGRITIETLNSAPDKIAVRVTDTGIGIESEAMDKIFNAFEQGKSDITRRFGGLGLGLSISKALIDAHGGKIRVESPGKDQGATFTVELNTSEIPVERDGEAEAGPADEKLEPAVSNHRRVLVVDDHYDTCLGMKRMLERRGYHITIAHSAEQAVEKVRTEDFDLLISDIGLPDRSGYDLMRELRLNKRLPGIALSGFGTEQDVNQAKEAGFSEHLTKPINFERLQKTIQSLLS